MTDIFLASIVLGMVAGLLAGLFGIGGGLVIVPVLVVLFFDSEISGRAGYADVGGDFISDHHIDGHLFRMGASSFGLSGVV